MKINLFDTGLSGYTLDGNITLVEYDERTQDFKLSMERKGLRIVEPKTQAPEMGVDEWAWLKDYPIESITIDDKTITPTWKPNAFGEQADENTFQQVKLLDDRIEISVHANGTPEEVYNRYQPYVNQKPTPANAKHADIKTVKQTFDQLTNNQTPDQSLDSIANHLFE